MIDKVVMDNNNDVTFNNTNSNNNVNKKNIKKLKSDEFDLLWTWLILKNTNVLDFGEKVNTCHVKRVFIRLDIFPSDCDATAFINSWGCQDSDTILPDELERGISKLSSSQFDLFYLFISALQRKDRQDGGKYQELRQKFLKKKEHQWKNMATIKLKKPSKQIQPCDKALQENDQNGHLVSPTTIKSFKKRHGLIKKKSNYFSRILTFLRRISGRDVKVLPMSSHRETFSDITGRTADIDSDRRSSTGDILSTRRYFGNLSKHMLRFQNSTIMKDPSRRRNHVMDSYALEKQPSEDVNSSRSSDSQESHQSSVVYNKHIW